MDNYCNISDWNNGRGTRLNLCRLPRRLAIITMEDSNENKTPAPDAGTTQNLDAIKPDFSVKEVSAEPQAPALPKAPLPSAPESVVPGVSAPSISLPKADTSKTFAASSSVPRARPTSAPRVVPAPHVEQKSGTSAGAVLVDALSAVVAIAFAVLIILDV